MNKNPTALMTAYVNASNALADILEDIVANTEEEDLVFYHGLSEIRLAAYKVARADYEARL